MLKAMNYKPKTWAAYAIYCAIPLACYIYYLYCSVKEESLVQKLANLTNDYPILWGVYIIVLAIPVVFILYICCKPSSSASQTQDKEELNQAAEKKKTDEVTEDVQENNEVEPEAEAEVNDEDAEKNSEPDSEEDNEAVEEQEPTENKSSGDGARKRKVRKD